MAAFVFLLSEPEQCNAVSSDNKLKPTSICNQSNGTNYYRHEISRGLSDPAYLILLQDQIALLPSLPAPATALFSRGLAMGGSSHQLITQLSWLVFVIGWTLLLTVPLCVVLMMLGVHPYTGAPPLSGCVTVRKGLRKGFGGVMHKGLSD